MILQHAFVKLSFRSVASLKTINIDRWIGSLESLQKFPSELQVSFGASNLSATASVILKVPQVCRIEHLWYAG